MLSNEQSERTELHELFEIRIESIGGLGANLAGKMLAEAGVLGLGLNGSNYSSYGSEKKGSPVTTFIRFAPPDMLIRDSSPIEQPNVVSVFHEALFRTQNCTRGLRADGVLIVNTRKTPAEIRKLTGYQAGTVVCVDALGISIEEKTRINTAMLGTLCRIVDFLDTEVIKSGIRATFEKKYPALVESNLRTFDRGFTEIKVDVASSEVAAAQEPYRRPAPSLGFVTQPMGGVILNPGNSVLKDLSSSRQGFVPEFKAESCIHCAACDQVCPDFCFVWSPQTDSHGRTFQFLQGIDYQYCKGCLKCVEACPTDALAGLRETEGYADAHQTKHAFNLA